MAPKSVNSEDSTSENDQHPRIMQWQDDQDFGSEYLDQFKPVQPEERLAQIPLGALRRAQRTLAKQHLVEDDLDDSEGHSDVSSESGESVASSSSGAPTQTKNKPSKRKNKHAPTEMSSKRPVTRRRQVIDVDKVVPRDPRFFPASGELSTENFRNSYSFLSESRQAELSTLREELKRAQRRMSSVAKADRPEHEAEISRLELAVKRAESGVHKDKRDAVEQKALHEARGAEKRKRKEGKGNWWMKQAEKKDLLIRARFDALAAEGGKRSVKKAMDKRQKKQSQKEKKTRPFARQSMYGVDESRPQKRRKVG
ncbi:hypothetical protein DL96DRAFT_1573686 [Flagelloscypha sp. PMI_526]|nr:hypothetical protein DL96DRAFT_1573686 [Flagelloscypha sp. PMI_526]